MIIESIIVIAAVLIALWKKFDARLVLLLAGMVLMAITGNPLGFIDVISKQLSNAEVVGPICSAMGYAFVLRRLGADTALASLLARPLRHASILLVAGGCLIGFITNIAITSQTAAAAAVGPILIPLMLAAGYSRLAAGATLLVGCSIGGNLFNPGDADIVTVRTATHMPVDVIMSMAILPNIVALLAAMIVLTVMLRQKEYMRPATADHSTRSDHMSLRRIVFALLAPLPVVILVVTQPKLGLFPLLHKAYPHGLPVHGVMIVSAIIAMIVGYRTNDSVAAHTTKITGEFFDGFGYGLAKVVSIIIAASCFLAGLKDAGLIVGITSLLLQDPDIAASATPVATWLLAMISGSGTAPAVAFGQAVLPSFIKQGQSGLAVLLGLLACIGANVGRTMSPVSAVMLFVGELSQSEPRQLIRVISPALLTALLIVILYGIVSS